MKQTQQVLVQDLGRIAYDQALEVQKKRLDELVAIKKQNRNRYEKIIPNHYFIFCEHPPVFTLGRTGDESNLLLDAVDLSNRHIDYYKTNRGGDITFHGPGQIVGYPIFDLEFFFTDVHQYVRYIEEAVIRTLAEYGIGGQRMKGFTGVWLKESQYLPQRKICAIGIHLSRWISMHGFALNVNTDLNYFDMIIPCGISAKDKSVTSLYEELNRKIRVEEVQKKLITHFADLFEFKFRWVKGETEGATG